MKKTLFLTLVLIACLANAHVFAQLPTTALDISPLLIGEIIPDAPLTDTKGNTQSLYSITKNKPTLIIFYRGDWCYNCINHFNDEIVPNLSEIEKLGYNFIAISPDSPENLLKTSGQTKIAPTSIFADGDGSLSKAMGISWKQQDRMLDMILESSGGTNKEGYLPVPAVYVVDAKNQILFQYINPNGPQSDLRIKGKLLLAVLEAL